MGLVHTWPQLGHDHEGLRHDHGAWAAAPAAAGPSSRRRRSPASSRTGTPSVSALSYFDPGLSPATTKLVFFDTEDAVLPPSAVTASAAWSRVNPASVPVITTMTPASGGSAPAPPAGSARAVPKSTPAARHLSTIATCQSTPNQSTSEAAMVGPTPSTAASRSAGAAAIASSEPNSAASARAAVGPTCRIDSATRIRYSGLLCILF